MPRNITTASARIFKEDEKIIRLIKDTLNARNEKELVPIPTRMKSADVLHAALKLCACTVTGEVLAFQKNDFDKLIREEYIIPAVMRSLAMFNIEAKIVRMSDGEACLRARQKGGKQKVEMDFPMEEKSAPVMN